MGSSCQACSKSEPDVDERNFKRHLRKSLIPQDIDNAPIHACVIEKDINKLKKACSRYKDKINELDHHGYTALHLCVLLGWEEGINILLSYYASPIITSLSGWTSIDEAISTKQIKILNKLMIAIIDNFTIYSKQNVSSIYKQFTHSNSRNIDFYIEMKLETFAAGFSSITGSYFPSDTLKIWKSGGLIRVDMTLIGFNPEKKEWIRGNKTNIYIIKQSGTFDYYDIDHQNKTIELEKNCALLSYDNINFDLSSKSIIKNEIKKLMNKAVKIQKIEIKNSNLKRSKSFLGNKLATYINDIECEIYKASDIYFVTKCRTQHIPIHKRPKHVKNESGIMSLMLQDDDDDDDNDIDDDIDYKYDDNYVYNAPIINIVDYENISSNNIQIADKLIQKNIKFDKDETFILNSTETNISKTNYNVEMCMTTDYGITIKEILPIFDLIGLKTKHMDSLKRILQLTAYDESRFPLKLEIPLLLNIVRAKITFQNLDRSSIDKTKFAIPNNYS